MQGPMASFTSQVCAVHRLPTVQEIDLDGSQLNASVFMKLSQKLLQHIDNIVPQPAHSSHLVAWSVERAVRASYGIASWA